MPLYHYKALDDLGHTLRGEMEASSESTLESLLRKRGQWLTEARERSAAAQAKLRPRGNRRAPRRVLIEFFLQTGLQLRSGIALVDALSFGLEHTENPPF